jgi:CheY-like chemotaxis protein
MKTAQARVLLVEDDPDIAASVGDVLKAEGYDLVEATSGDEAIRAVEAHCPDLVLLDWRLPIGPVGTELVRRLRDQCERLPIVVVSADPGALSEARAADVSDYLPKPFSIEDLLHVVDTYAK